MKPTSLPEGLTAEADTETTVLSVTREVSARIGIDYFRGMATRLAQSLKADCVLIGEFTTGPVQRVITLAASLEGQESDLTFDLAASVASRIAATGKPVICRRDARHRFPSDPLLSRLHAEACIAATMRVRD